MNSRLIKTLALMIFVAALAILAMTLVNGVANAEPDRTSTATCVPQDAWDEEVFDYWQRYSWTGGPHTSDDPPAFPSSDWQPNVQGDPHGVGQPGPYFRSHGNSGNGDWFYLEAVTKTIHHPAVECPTETSTPTETETTDVPCTDQPVGTTEGCPTTSTPPSDTPTTSTPTEGTPEPSNPVTSDAPEVETFCDANECVKISTNGDGSKETETVEYGDDVLEEGF